MEPDSPQGIQLSVSPIPSNPVTYHGKGGELFGIFIKNMLLTVITLGFYSFWARVKISKYLYSSVRFLDGPFGYHATGEERFFAFLKGIGMVFLFFVGFFAMSFLFTSILGNTIGPIITGVLFVAFIIGIQPVLVYGSHRFRMSRSSWNNVRFRFQIPLKTFVLEYVTSFLLVILTLGIYTPWFVAKLSKLMIANTYLGTRKFDYEGNGKEVFFIYLKGLLLLIPTLGLSSFGIMAALFRYTCEKTTLEDTRLKSTLTWDDLFVTFILSNLLIIFTLGLGIPFAINMIFEKVFSRLEVTGEPVVFQGIRNISDSGASPLADGVSEAADAADAIGSAFT